LLHQRQNNDIRAVYQRVGLFVERQKNVAWFLFAGYCEGFMAPDFCYSYFLNLIVVLTF
jgi:hypothetical protein